MSMAQLLLRGMIVGIVAGLLAFAFARVYGEPAVERSIAFETAAALAKGDSPEPELVGRRVQSTIGLLTGTVVVGTALGGLFAILFAVGHGRFSTMRPRGFAALLGLVCFVTLYLVPDLKYPANPPAVGEPDTIGIRTGLYFSMMAISVIATTTAFSLRRLLVPRLASFDATLAGAFAFLVMVAIAYRALPPVNEVPASFPAQTLWTFRLASLGLQAVLWGTLALLFGVLVDRAGGRPLPSRARASAPMGEHRL